MATDGLTALRQCIIAGRDGGVREDGDFLIIDGVRYAADTPTAFRQSRVQSGYPLMGVWLQWKLRTLSVAEYIKASNAAKTKFVLITDKNTLLDYLMGKSEAGDYIDASKLGIAPQAPTAALESVAATSDASSQSLELAIRKEIAYRSREKVLQAPGKVRLQRCSAVLLRRSGGGSGPQAQLAARLVSPVRCRIFGMTCSNILGQSRGPRPLPQLLPHHHPAAAVGQLRRTRAGNGSVPRSAQQAPRPCQLMRSAAGAALPSS